MVMNETLEVVLNLPSVEKKMKEIWVQNWILRSSIVYFLHILFNLYQQFVRALTVSSVALRPSPLYSFVIDIE